MLLKLHVQNHRYKTCSNGTLRRSVSHIETPPFWRVWLERFNVGKGTKIPPRHVTCYTMQHSSHFHHEIPKFYQLFIEGRRTRALHNTNLLLSCNVNMMTHCWVYSLPAYCDSNFMECEEPTFMYLRFRARK